MLFQGLLSAVLAVFSFMIASVDEAEYTRKLSTIAGMDNLKPDDKNYRAGMRTKKIAWYRQVFKVLSTYNMAPDAFRVMVPALVMNGGKDRLASAERGRNLAQTIRFGEFDLVEGAGHTLPLQKPEYVSGRIFVFCGERND